MKVGRIRSDMGKVVELWLTCSGVFLVLLVPSVIGWGYEGHFAVCKIAQGFLTEEALSAVKALLPDHADGELAAVCSWPDEFRKLMPWSTELHYVNAPDSVCNYKYCRDCHDSAGNKDRCVTGAIFNYTKQLQLGVYDLNSETNYNLTEALMFVSHFFGDVHQPLHAGFAGDAGGNYIKVFWYQNETNLHRGIQPKSHIEEIRGHLNKCIRYLDVVDMSLSVSPKKIMERGEVKSLYNNLAEIFLLFLNEDNGDISKVWDDMIIESSLKTFYNTDLSSLIQALQSKISGVWFTDSLSWKNCTSDHVVCPDPYASESIKLACKFAYKDVTQGDTLGDEYFLSRLPVVEKRLAQAGVRLAATLNRIFGSQLHQSHKIKCPRRLTYVL